MLLPIPLEAPMINTTLFLSARAATPLGLSHWRGANIRSIESGRTTEIVKRSEEVEHIIVAIDIRIFWRVYERVGIWRRGSKILFLISALSILALVDIQEMRVKVLVGDLVGKAASSFKAVLDGKEMAVV